MVQPRRFYHQNRRAIMHKHVSLPPFLPSSLSPLRTIFHAIIWQGRRDDELMEVLARALIERITKASSGELAVVISRGLPFGRTVV